MSDNSIVNDILAWNLADEHKLAILTVYLLSINDAGLDPILKAESIIAEHASRGGLTRKRFEDFSLQKKAREAKFSELLTDFANHAIDTEENSCGCPKCQEFFRRVKFITTSRDYRNLLKGPLFALVIQYLDGAKSLEEAFTLMLGDIYRLRTYTRKGQLESLLTDSPPVAEEGSWIDSNSGPGYTPTEA